MSNDELNRDELSFAVPEGINPLLATAIVSVMGEFDRAFAELWSRPDGPAVMEGFLSGRIVFQLERRGLTIAERASTF
jgi:hypothetical protein